MRRVYSDWRPTIACRKSSSSPCSYSNKKTEYDDENEDDHLTTSASGLQLPSPSFPAFSRLAQCIIPALDEETGENEHGKSGGY